MSERTLSERTLSERALSEPSAVRLRYLADAIATASPAQRIVMLYDRLALDIERGRDELAAGDRVAASAQLRHGIAIVSELWGSLDISSWSGAQNLIDLYGFVLNELIEADRSGDWLPLAGCLGIVDSLRDSWTRAAELVEAAPVAVAVGGRVVGSWVG